MIDCHHHNSKTALGGQRRVHSDVKNGRIDVNIVENWLDSLPRVIQRQAHGVKNCIAIQSIVEFV